MKIIEKYNLSERDIDRIIEMSWEDRTPFEAIKHQFGLTEGEVIKFMKSQIKLNSWKKWRSRVQGRSTKHRELRSVEIGKFKSSRQKQISYNNISKRK